MKYFAVSFDIKVPKAVVGDVCDVLSAMLGNEGFESFEQRADGLEGYVQQSLFDADGIDMVLQSLPFPDVEVGYSVSEMADIDWNAQWEEEGFEPIVISGLRHNRVVVIHDGRHLPAQELTDDHALAIEIDAHLAFGTGNHATTRLIVSMLSDMDLTGKRLLDCGTGTGILSLAALRLGASSATGYDIDEWSVDNAMHNAVINRLDDHFTSILGDSRVTEDIDGLFDVVVANINRNILLADMPRFVKKLCRGGALILSGFYDSDAAMLESEALRYGLRLIEKKTEDGWCALRLG